MSTFYSKIRLLTMTQNKLDLIPRGGTEDKRTSGTPYFGSNIRREEVSTGRTMII
jgi:hypothetical protein